MFLVIINVKNKIIISLLVLLAVLATLFISFKLINYYKIKNAKILVKLNDNLDVNFLEKRKVSSFIKSINGKITNDYLVDTKEIGKKKVKINYINDDNIKVSYEFNINVVDKVAPVIWLSNSYNIYLGDDSNLASKILCGDNYDNNPKCYIEGSYDPNGVGSYKLVYKAIDSSGNVSSKNFTLNVIENNNSKTNNKETKYVYFNDVINEYKSDNNLIGIDVSKWQGDIDFDKVKKSGASFVMIKVGSSKLNDKNYILDPKFKYNIENAINSGLKVGIYFYSSANSNYDAKKEAKWVLKQIKGYKIDLPIAFDWENFSYFNEFNLSFFGLTSMADTFINEVKKEGYDSVIYGSKNYLENIWLLDNQKVWLAHYTKKTNYNGNYIMWQLTEDGKIDGINTKVDIDILYN